MTAVAAIITSEHLTIGADRLVDMGYGVCYTAETKVWKKENGSLRCLFGYAGNLKTAQILQDEFLMPETENECADVAHYIRKRLVPEMWKVLSQHDILKNDDGRKVLDGSLLVCTQQKIFHLSGALSVHDVGSTFAAIGQGEGVAWGVLDELDRSLSTLSPSEKIDRAIRSAVKRYNGCAGDPLILSI